MAPETRRGPSPLAVVVLVLCVVAVLGKEASPVAGGDGRGEKPRLVVSDHTHHRVRVADLTERGASQTTKGASKRNSNTAVQSDRNAQQQGIVAGAAVSTTATAGQDGATLGAVPSASYDQRRPPPQVPVYVNIAFELKRLYGIHESEGTCSYSIFVLMMWADTRLKYPASFLREGEEFINLDPSTVWHPVVEPSGATMVRKTKEVVRVRPSGDVMMVQKMQVDASSMFDLSWFPFDQQRIPLDFSLYTYTVDQVVLQLNSNWDPWYDEAVAPFVQGATNSVNIHAKPSWNIYGFDGEVVEYTIHGDDQKWSRVAVWLDVKRRYFYYMMAYFIPLILITLTGNTAFYIDPQDNGSRIGVTMGSVLALVAMEYVLLSELPKSGYVMWIHIYIIGQFLMVCTPTLFSFITSHLNNDKHYDRKTDIQKIKPEERQSPRTWLVLGCLFLLPTGYSSDIVKKVDNIGLIISLTTFAVFNVVMFAVAGWNAYS